MGITYVPRGSVLNFLTAMEGEVGMTAVSLI